MKKISLVFLLVFSILFCCAQEQNAPSLRRKKGGEPSQTQTQNQTQQTENQNVKPTVSSGDNFMLREAIKNTFLVVQQSYNVRKNGVLVEENDFFGHCYTILPLLKYGYGVDMNFSKPWLKDKRYKEYADCSECMVSVDRIQYKRLSDEKGEYQPFKLDDRISDTLAPSYFHVREAFFDNKGLDVQVGNGVKTGYMVWFFKGDRDVYFNISSMTITYNENLIFNLAQPGSDKNVLGGFFLNVNVSEPGVITLDLLGVARLDPYGGGYWELVKMQKRPTSPDGENDEKNAKKNVTSSSDNHDSGASNSKNNKKGRKGN